MYLNVLHCFLVRTATNVCRKYPKYSTKANKYYESHPKSRFKYLQFLRPFVWGGGGICVIVINNGLIFIHIRIKDARIKFGMWSLKTWSFFFESILIT